MPANASGNILREHQPKLKKIEVIRKSAVTHKQVVIRKSVIIHRLVVIHKSVVIHRPINTADQQVHPAKQLILLARSGRTVKSGISIIKIITKRKKTAVGTFFQ